MAKRSAISKFSDARGAGEAFLGVEVSWDLGEYATDIAIPRDKFEQLFIEAGVDPNYFLPRPTPEDSLPLATRIGWSHETGVDSRTITVKQLSRPDKDTPLAFGVYYRISVEGERDRWEIGARVRMSKVPGLQYPRAVIQPPADDHRYPSVEAKAWAEAIAKYANDRTDTAFNADISNTLVYFGNRLGWVSRRQSGGVYFLPGNLGERFMRVLDGLEALTQDLRPSFEGNTTPQYADPRTLQTWQRRTKATIEMEIVELTKKLADMSSRDNVREASFDSRVAECNALMQKANQYAEVLQKELKPLLVAIKKLKGEFGDAQKKLIEAKFEGDSAFNSISKLADKAAKQVKARKVKKAVAVRQVPAPSRVHSKAEIDALFDEIG